MKNLVKNFIPDSSSTLVDQVKRGELDAGFVSRSFAAPGLREEQIFTDKLVVLAPVKVKTRNDLFEVNRIGLKILVQRLGCSYTERLLTFLETKKVRPERIMEMGTLEGVLGFVEAGVGIAAMPESFIDRISKARKVVMLPLPEEVATLRTYIVSSQHTASPLVSDFVDHCCPGATE